jgi:hypothetical protein
MEDEKHRMITLNGGKDRRCIKMGCGGELWAIKRFSYL